MTEIIRVLRILEYVGPREIVEKTLRHCAVPVNGERDCGSGGLRIKSALVGTFGDVVAVVDDTSVPDDPTTLYRKPGFYGQKDCTP